MKTDPKPHGRVHPLDTHWLFHRPCLNDVPPPSPLPNEKELRDDGAACCTRRDFLRTTSAGVLASLVIPGLAVPSTAKPASRTPDRWYEHVWRRAVIDMHIPDWDPEFLSRFDPDEYVRALRTSRAQSIVLYAQSHTGLFNYPTQVGQQHQGLKLPPLSETLDVRSRR
jgi:hypothetical protein